jgi:hypothetical protein
MPDELKILTSVSSEAEAEMVRDRLGQAGIGALSQRAIGGPEWGGSGARNVFVSEKDLPRAHAVLEADAGSFSDEELARLSEEAAREANADD